MLSFIAFTDAQGKYEKLPQISKKQCHPRFKGCACSY